MNQLIPIAIVGPGKIARDQHLPAIEDGADFRLVACVGNRSLRADVPYFPDVATLRAAGIAVQAAAICTPPQVRTAIALAAIEAGWHVFLEKPPAQTLSEAEQLRAAGEVHGVTLLASWHSRYAAQVEPARAWLAGRQIHSGRVVWRENVRQWHPGQRWLWQPGGLGVFDPGINALSILTRICPLPLSVATAQFEVPANCATPIAAQLALRHGSAAIEVDFDFRQTGHQSWYMFVQTDAGELALHDGGARMIVNGTAAADRENREYKSLYDHFAALIRGGQSDMDLAPLRLVADAFMVAETRQVEVFED